MIINIFTNQLIGYKKGKGYVALISILIVSTVALFIALGVALMAADELKSSSGTDKAEEVFYIADSCIEEGLNRLRNSWSDYSGSLSVGGGSCTISIITNGSYKDINVTAVDNAGDFTKSIKATVNNTSPLSIISWDEQSI